MVMQRESSIRTQTESHIPHLSLPFSLCVVSFSHKRSLLFSAIPSDPFLPFFHPSGIHVCFYSHLSVTAAWWASHRFSSSVYESICSFLFLLTSFYSPVWLCLLLAHPPLLPWIHAFHVGTFLSIHKSSELRCAYLAVWAFVLWVEVNGQEGEQEDKSEQTGSYDLRCYSQFPLSRSFFLSPPFSLRLSIMTSSLCHHASPCILVSKERERGGV